MGLKPVERSVCGLIQEAMQWLVSQAAQDLLNRAVRRAHQAMT